MSPAKRPRGRPPIGDKPMRRRFVFLSDAEYAKAERLGNGNASAGIRLALKRVRT